MRARGNREKEIGRRITGGVQTNRPCDKGAADAELSRADSTGGNVRILAVEGQSLDRSAGIME